MSFKIGFNEMVRILKEFGCDDFDAPIIADYLTECIDYEMDLSYYVWNTLLFGVHCFKTKDEALQFLEDNYSEGFNDYVLYECDVGVYLECN